MGTHRCFISVDCPPNVQAAIATFQEKFDDVPGVRLVDPAQTHVTLKFLGEIADDELDQVEELLADAVASADITSFEARFGRLGVFPEYDYISVIWVGVPKGGSAMETVHEAIEARFVDAGYEPEPHDEFTPHVTIARMDHGEGKETVQALLRTEDPDLGGTTVEEVRLKESHLRADGPEYETLSAVRLAT